MAKPITLTVRPRLGRGLSTRVGGPDAGELWDAFLQFENIVSKEGAWHAIRGDSSASVAATGPVRSSFAYNRDVAGVPTTQIVAVFNNTLRDSNLAAIEVLSDPYDIYYNSVKNRLFYGGRNNEPRVWNSTLLASWGAWGPIGVPTYSSLVSNNVDSGVQVQTVGVTAGSPAVTRVTGTAFQLDPAWVGKTIMIDGVEYPIQTVTGASALTLAINYAGATASPVAAQVHYGNRSWTRAPKYAYAYYNPTTGHVTNGSPVLTLAETEMTNVSPEIGAIAANPTLNGYGYTKIVVFRTPQDGGQMLPLMLPASEGDGLGFFNNSGGPHQFTDTTDDTALGQILGRREMPTENDPCPQHIYQAYWRNRFFVIDEAEPWKVRYSADPSLALGVPEESFPPQYFVEIPTDDGYGLGLQVVGEDLLILTQKYALFMAGTGPGSFEPRRISTRGFGVTQRAIAEHPGDSSIEQSSAIYVSRDKRLWRHFSGGRIEDIGAPIQEFLDRVRSISDFPSPFLVTVCLVDRHWLLVLGISQPEIPAGQTPEYDLYFFDFDTQMWMNWQWTYLLGRRADALCPFVQMNLGSSNDGMARLLIWSGSTSPISSFPFTIAGAVAGYMKQRYADHGQWEIRKKLLAIRLFTDDSSEQPYNDWAVTVTRDNIGSVVYPMRLTSSAQSPRLKGQDILEFVLDEGQVLHYHAISPAITIPHGRRLFRYDIVCTPEETLEMGAP